MSDNGNVIDFDAFREKRSQKPVAPLSRKSRPTDSLPFRTAFLETNPIARKFKEEYYETLLTQTEVVDRNPFYRRLRRLYADDIAIYNIVRAKLVLSSFYREFPEYGKSLPEDLAKEIELNFEAHPDPDNYAPADIIDAIIPHYNALEKYLYDGAKFGAMTREMKILASRLFTNMSFAWWVIYRRSDRSYHGMNSLAAQEGFIGIYVLQYSSELPFIVSALEERDRFLCVGEDQIGLFEDLAARDKLFTFTGFRFLARVYSALHSIMNPPGTEIHHVTRERESSYGQAMRDVLNQMAASCAGKPCDESDLIEIAAVAQTVYAIFKLKKIDVTRQEVIDCHKSHNHWISDALLPGLASFIDSMFPEY